MDGEAAGPCQQFLWCYTTGQVKFNITPSLSKQILEMNFTVKLHIEEKKMSSKNMVVSFIKCLMTVGSVPVCCYEHGPESYQISWRVQNVISSHI